MSRGHDPVMSRVLILLALSASSPAAAIRLVNVISRQTPARHGAVLLQATADVAAAEALVDVRAVEGKGFGVFSVEAIEEGAWVCSYDGVEATDDECDERYNVVGGGDYIFRLEDKSHRSPRGLVLDAANSSHFSRYFNHAEEASLEAKVSAVDRRVDFFALRSVAAGEELCFDYGVEYWRGRDPPLPSTDGRDYSRAGWALRDEQAKWLDSLFPPAVGTSVPLTPLRSVELQAALCLPESESRRALLRCLEYFGSQRVLPDTSSGAGSLEDELVEVPCGLGPTAPRLPMRTYSVSVDELAEASAACIAEAQMAGGGLSDAVACCSLCQASAPQGDALLEWLTDAAAELGAVRRWRSRVPRLASARRDAAAIASYLLYKNPHGHGVTSTLTPARVDEIVAHLKCDSEDDDARAHNEEEVLAMLAVHAPREHVEALVDVFECWVELGDGLSLS